MKCMLGFVLVVGLGGLGVGLGQEPIRMVRDAWPEEHGPDAAVRVSAGVMAGQALERAQPIYPPIAKAAGISGAVVVRMLIGKDGRVERVMALYGPQMLWAPAEDAVRRGTYRPYLLNGEPQRVDTTVTVDFQLPGVVAGNAGLGKSGGTVAGAPTPVFCGSLKAGEPGYHQRVSGGVMQGLLVHRVDPVYPRVGINGAMIMAVCVSAAGSVESVDVISGPEALRAAAVDAVKQWVYRPYRLNGEAVPVSMVVSITMALGAPPPQG